MSDAPPMTEANADLMAPIAEILNGSDKDLPTKVGVLFDCAAALLATSPRMRRPGELRDTAEEARKRLIKVVRLHQAESDRRQENARAALEQVPGVAFMKGPPKGGTNGSGHA